MISIRRLGWHIRPYEKNQVKKWKYFYRHILSDYEKRRLRTQLSLQPFDFWSPRVFVHNYRWCKPYVGINSLVYLVSSRWIGYSPVNRGYDWIMEFSGEFCFTKGLRKRRKLYLWVYRHALTRALRCRTRPVLTLNLGSLLPSNWYLRIEVLLPHAMCLVPSTLSGSHGSSNWKSFQQAS